MKYPIFEYDTVFADDGFIQEEKHRHIGVPQHVYEWLKKKCLNMDDDATRWLKLKRVGSVEAIQFTGYVGVLRSPRGFQIEVLPKTGKHSNGDVVGTRQLLVRMLMCMRNFKHYKTSVAALEKVKMPLLEVYIRLFLLAVEAVVRRGLRSDYVANQDNLFALRGKLLWSQHLKQNIVRRDRFFTEHDEFSPNRPENRLLHSALKRVLKISRSAENQKLARELGFVFNEIVESTDIAKDFQKVRLDRGMEYYEPSLDWAKLLLNNQSPLTGTGKSEAISLMFPMAALFEAYVAKHLRAKLNDGFHLKEQVRSKNMVKHKVNGVDQEWFLLKPDLLIHNGDPAKPALIMDTKWKLLDSNKSDGTNKYDLSQADFYQLFAYGQYYLGGVGDLVLIYPKTDSFSEPLPVFSFDDKKPSQLRLWVVPFCLIENNDKNEKIGLVINPKDMPQLNNSFSKVS